MSRLVPLDPVLLGIAVAQERDSVTAAFAAAPGYAAQALSGPAFALLDGGAVIGAGGLVPHWRGRAEGWWLTGQCARPRHLVHAARLARAFLDDRQRDPAFRRIEIFIRAGEPWASSFARALGFTCEGRLQAWDPAGRDMCIFARVAP